MQAPVYSVRRNDHCCAVPIMISSGQAPIPRGNRLENASKTYRASASAIGGGSLSPDALAQRAVDGAHRIPPDRKRIRQPDNGSDPGAIAARRDRLHRGPGGVGHAQHRYRADRGYLERRPPHHRQQRGRAVFRQQAHHRISAGFDRRHDRDAASDGARCRRYRGHRHHLGLPGAVRHHDPDRDRGSPRQSQAAFDAGGPRDRPAAHGPDAAYAENPRQAIRPFRAGASDLHAAPRQPRLVFIRRLALRRRQRPRCHRGDRRHRRPGFDLALRRAARRDAPALLQ